MCAKVEYVSSWKKAESTCFLLNAVFTTYISSHISLSLSFSIHSERAGLSGIPPPWASTAYACTRDHV